MKRTVLKFVANVALKTANKACGSASLYGFYQPKEPKISQVKKESSKAEI